VITSQLARDMQANDVPMREGGTIGTTKRGRPFGPQPTIRPIIAVYIEKGVPLPKAQRMAPRYAFDKMEVGDSFTVPVPKGMSSDKLAKHLRDLIANYRRRGGTFAFSVIQLPKVHAVGIWRVAKARPGGRKRKVTS
jgi:hypothetical protein